MNYRPENLNIGGHETKLRVGQQDNIMTRLNQIGEFDREEFTIDVKGGLSETYTDQIITHEILHAFFRIADISGIDDTLEEALCHGLENVFYRFMAENDLSWFRTRPKVSPALEQMKDVFRQR